MSNVKPACRQARCQMSNVILRLTLVLLCIVGLASNALAASRWIDVTPAGYTDTLYGVTFVSETTGFAVGSSGKVLKTTDRGITWTQSTAGANAYTWYGIKAVTSSAIKIAGTNGTIASIYKSDDTGSTWSPDYSTSNLSTFQAINFSSDGTVGSAVGAAAAGLAYNASFSTSGTWAADVQTSTGFETLYAVACPASNVFYAVGNVVSDKYGIFKSSNGVNWSASSYSGSNALYGICALDTTKVWAVGDLGTVIYTTDGGTNWGAKNIGSTVAQRSIHFYDANNGWIVGNAGEIRYTSDGGVNWTTQTSGTSQPLRSVYSLDANNVWAVGVQKILKLITDPTITAVTFEGNVTTIQQGQTKQATVIGTNFQSGITTASLNLGSGITVSALTRDSSTQLTLTVAVAAAAATGARNASLVNPDTGAGTMESAFTVLSSTPPVSTPTITSIDFGGRSSRYVGWSGTCTVTGTGFNDPIVSTDIPSSILFTRSSWTATTIVGTITLGSASTHTFRVTNTSDGGSTEASFTVNKIPVVSSCTPNTATQEATVSTFNIGGENFQSGITFAFSSTGITQGTGTYNSANSYTTSLTIVAATPTGVCTVTATNPDGGVGTGEGTFFINPKNVSTAETPAVDSVSPTYGTQGAANLDVTITGQHLPPNHTVNFGSGITVVSTTRASDTSLTARINIAAAATTGMRSVSVTSTESGATGTLNNAFTVQSATDTTTPTLTSISPSTIYSSSTGSSTTAFAVSATTTSETMYLLGTNFDSGSIVTFSPNLTVLASTYSSATAFRVTISRPSSSGTYSVTITRSNGRSATLAALTVREQSITPVIADDPTSRVFQPNPWKPSSGPVTFQFRATADIAAINIAIYSINGDTLYKSPQPIPVTAGYNKILLDGIANVRGSGHFIPNGLLNVLITNANTGQVLAKAKLVVLD